MDAQHGGDVVMGNAEAHLEGPPLPGIPNHTIYVNNLPEQFKETALKNDLTAIFKQFGKILEIVAMSSFRRRGQAFIAFETVESATKAHKLNGFPFHNKPLRVTFARSKSDAVAKRDGSYQPRPKRELGPKPLSNYKRRKVAEEPATDAAAFTQVTLPVAADPTVSAAHQPLQQQPSSQMGYAPTPQGPYGVPPPFMVGGGGTMPPMPPPPHMQNMPPHMMPPPYMQAPPVAAAAVKPQGPVANHILLLTGLPEETTEMMLSMLFDQFSGFKEVRLVPSRHDIAFVEYESEAQATAARQGLDNFELKAGCNLTVNYAKKSS